MRGVRILLVCFSNGSWRAKVLVGVFSAGISGGEDGDAVLVDVGC